MPDKRTRTKLSLTVLQQADELLAGWTCPGTAECCHLASAGHQPYLTEAEWSVIEQEIARQGRRMPPPRDDGTCAFLSAAGRCTIYAARPLGCRTYFCDRADGPGRFPRAALAPLARELEALSEPEPGAGQERGRPLGTWLRTAQGRRRAPRRR